VLGHVTAIRQPGLYFGRAKVLGSRARFSTIIELSAVAPEGARKLPADYHATCCGNTAKTVIVAPDAG
jgi:hypothetical protein